MPHALLSVAANHAARRFDASVHVGIVTHGLTLRVFLMRWLHWSVREFLQVRVAVGGGRARWRPHAACRMLHASEASAALRLALLWMAFRGAA